MNVTEQRPNIPNGASAAIRSARINDGAFEPCPLGVALNTYTIAVVVTFSGIAMDGISQYLGGGSMPIRSVLSALVLVFATVVLATLPAAAQIRATIEGHSLALASLEYSSDA